MGDGPTREQIEWARGESFRLLREGRLRVHRTPEREREMARSSALYTLERRKHVTVEEVMSNQGLDAPHALFALEGLRDNGICERTEAGVYLLIDQDEEDN